MTIKRSVAVIGSGFAGMAAAAVLAKNDIRVTVLEKNETTGGRARVLREAGFTFDMGPSWFWMPDVYEKFYNIFGHTTSDFYELKKLDPGFAVIFGGNEVWDIPADFEEICNLFEDTEKGAGAQLQKFIDDGALKYQIGMGEMVYKPSHSILEFMSLKLARDAFKLQVFSSFKDHVRQHFRDPRLLALMEFPVLFLGAMPKDTPAMYSLMNYAGLKQGTYYPMGGFGKVAESFLKIARSNGVNIKTSHAVEALTVSDHTIVSVRGKDMLLPTDGVIGTADYHHIESQLLPEVFRSYPESYWEKRIMAPSCLIFYLGVHKKIDRLRHHNLFFDESFEAHAEHIYKDKMWPLKPLFYVSCPSKTDESVAPDGMENIFILMPIATGLTDNDAIREEYYDKLMERLEKFAGEDIRSHVIYKKSYCVSDFVHDYNAYQGNAYGLANTLMQTAIFKPKIKSQKINNLFYAGQLTVPGPGVPPSVISGQIAAHEMLKTLKK
ncbi:4,4'-diapophytoene desaturase (4,4'-diaponeurosporene-forming) [Dyadobacter sp. CECT 9275]|uniref:4,4'-diapophytoene desaturase (4,4'-diaponeurosporene-forming) n=1 Tax=Dyadobacter helix TaxID=2822344 RepID=A0A916JJ00_9BACT|nr:phytoene desaturase family protein [Dyadobacter sp. CECT 9275]CAG5017560.1 4,4'-diapophytoene desaturase (4,4'-diaponeurosporene-forming) [Dyadobacter sp. CECT 9275]